MLVLGLVAVDRLVLHQQRLRCFFVIDVSRVLVIMTKSRLLFRSSVAVNHLLILLKDFFFFVNKKALIE